MRTLLKFLLIFSSLLFVPISFASSEGLVAGVEKPYRAPLLLGISSWINSAPLKLSDLRGKVVLIEFWTNSCPYCRKALPYVNQWYSDYHDKGLLVIGVHSPKNEEEQSQTLVQDAVEAHGIHYPVALDNHFETWENYHVEGWPSFFLIDRKGYVVYVSYGAANYEVIENNIRFLLNAKDDT
ncbi:MAG TPA: redoxin family protein [Gammaproteobacteria bacterium]|nr:redoxin family protein [Gammaproteobacteria bacterium]